MTLPVFFLVPRQRQWYKAIPFFDRGLMRCFSFLLVVLCLLLPLQAAFAQAGSRKAPPAPTQSTDDSWQTELRKLREKHLRPKERKQNRQDREQLRQERERAHRAYAQARDSLMHAVRWHRIEQEMGQQALAEKEPVMLQSMSASNFDLVPDEVERQALVDLYNSTDGANWEDNTNWLQGTTSADFSTWYGVQVENGDVYSINLYHNNLNGTIPAGLGNLSNLQMLDLGYNSLNSAVPPELGSLSNLQYLWLSYNSMSGPIPPELGNLSNLQEFDLFGNNLNGAIPAELGGLSNLHLLWLSENNLSGAIPPELGNLSNLQVLSLDYNSLSSTIPAELGSLSSLESLYLGNNNLSGTVPAELGNLTTLVSLHLDNNNLSGRPEPISNLTELGWLDISFNAFISLPDFSRYYSDYPLNLYANDNLLDFGDIETNMTGADQHDFYTFTYSPQGPVGPAVSEEVLAGEPLTLTVETGGTRNMYQWQKQEGGVWQDIAGATASTYTVSSATLADAGVYRCRITNAWATELTLYTQDYTVTVSEEAPASLSQERNYILTRTPQVAGFESAEELAGKSARQVSQQVQYFDGLGRPLQTVQVKAGPGLQDLVQPVQYDAFGREARQYLPYAATGTPGTYRPGAVKDPATYTGSEQYAFYNTPSPLNAAVAPAAYPFAETVYEPSPLNRVTEQGAPGAAWQPASSGAAGAGHTVKTSYRTNTAGEVRLWEYDFHTDKYTSPGHYGAGELYVTEGRDEEGALTVEYKDKQGRVVLKKVQEAETVDSRAEAGFLVTQYVYDDLGQLRLVLQPEGVRRLHQAPVAPLPPCSPLSPLPCQELRAALPFALDFDAPVPGTIADKAGLGTGFTLVEAYSGTRHVEDGPPADPQVPGHAPSKLTLAAGRLQVESSKGIASNATNNQLNTLAVEVGTRERLQLETTLAEPYSGSSFQQAGLWLGLSDRTFVKLVVTGNQVELRRELEDASVGTGANVQRNTATLSGLDGQTVRLRLTVDPATQTVEGFYSTDGLTYVNVGASYPAPALDIAGMGITGGLAHAGIYATHRNGATPVTYTFEDFRVTSANRAPQVAQAPADQALTGGEAFSFAGGSYTDPDGGDVLAYAATLATGEALPGWLRFDAAAVSFSGTAPAGEATLTVRVTATDPAGARASAGFAVMVTPAPPLVRGLASATGRAYGLGALEAGVAHYTDREYLVTGLPHYLEGAPLVRTANDDKNSTGLAVLSFELTEPATVYVAYDPRATALPAWLSGWQPLSDKVGVGDAAISHMLLYAKTFPAGEVTLGGNKASPAAGAENNYFVAVRAGTGLPAGCPPLSPLPCRQLQAALPFVLDFEGHVPGTLSDRNGVGTGFTLAAPYSGTRHAEDGTPTDPQVPGYEPARLFLDTGRLKIHTNKGIAYLANNNQLNALAVEVATHQQLRVETALVNPYNSTSSQQAGLWLGLSDRDFVKLVVTGNRVELRKEQGDLAPEMRQTAIISGLSNQTVRLRLTVDPATNTVEGFYSTDGVSYMQVGASGLDIAGMGLTGGTAYAGIYATHRNGTGPVTYTFDSFGVAAEAGQDMLAAQAAAPQAAGTAEEAERVELTEAFLARWAFRYAYDGRSRVVEKQVPGAGPVELVYNKRDELILTRDAGQRARGEWHFTRYDVLGRPVLTGKAVLKGSDGQALTRAEVQAAADAHAQAGKPLYEERDGSPVGYTLDKSFPAVAEADLLTVSYYDTYDYGYLSGYASFTGEAGVAPSDVNERVRGQVTGTRTKVLGTEDWLMSVNYYDSKYRLLQTVSDSYVGGAVVARGERATSRYDFVGRALETLTIHQVPGQGAGAARTFAVARELSYDHMGRLAEEKQKTWEGSTAPAEWVVLACHSYNALGQLVDKQLHSRDGGSRFLQSVDTRYNIRGWLTSINDGSLSDPGDSPAGGDLFGLELVYERGMQLGTAGQHNGNISEALWSTASDRVQRGYGYRYDKANRLKGGDYKAFEGAGWTAEVDRYSVTGLTYDANGNILGLVRRGLSAGHAYDASQPRSYGVVDELAYAYEGNRLATVNDAEGGVAGPAGDFRDNGAEKAYREGSLSTWEYGYDASGNLTRDENKGITQISYNHLNLPERVAFGSKGSIQYTYAADGRKLRKTVQEAGKAAVSTDYSGLFVHSPEAVFAFTSEGRVLYEPQTMDKWRYEYHLKDHLGNLRVSFAEPTTTTEGATMEMMAAPVEEAQFDNVAETRHLDRSRARTGSHAALLSIARNRPLGPGKRVALHKGDSLKVEAFGLYETEQKKDLAFSLASWLASSATITAGTNAGGETGKGKANKAMPYIGAGIAVAPQIISKEKGTPKAYLRYLVYDSDSNYVASGYQALDEEARAGWQQLELSYTATTDGFAEVYVANESQEEVWFDDMSLSVTEPMLVQENHYDPWGMNLVGIEKQGTPDHKFQYNGKEKQSELGLEWLDYGARYYDPQLGRWHVVDPDAEEQDQESWSPYHYVYNNPIAHTDPDGRLPVPLIGAFIGATTDVALQSVEIALDDSKSFSKDFSYTSVAVSAVAGATGAGLASKIGKLGTVAKLVVEATHDGVASAANQYATEGKVDLKKAAVDATIGKAVGDVAGNVAGKAAKNTPAAKILKRESDRANNIAKKNPRPARTVKAAQAQKKMENYATRRATAASVSASGVGGKVVNSVVNPDDKKK